MDSSVKIGDNKRRLNQGESKYYDSEKLRKLRNVIWEPETGKPLSRIPLDIQDQFLPQLGLRLPFDKSGVQWQEEDRDFLRENLSSDIEKFIKYAKVPDGLWKKYENLVSA